MSWHEVSSIVRVYCLNGLADVTAMLDSLAYCELYLTLAAVFTPGRFTFEFHETDITDVEVEHDFFNACQRVDSKGIRVKVE